MKQKLSNLEIADMCQELSVFLHAGVQPGDGLGLLLEDEDNPILKQVYKEMMEKIDCGMPLSEAMKETQQFPVYVTGLVDMGETTGRTEETLSALSTYYEERDRMGRQIRGALTYPAILFLLMFVVIAVLLSRVLPVFSDIYSSLGGQLTGVAGGLLLLGKGVDMAMPVLCVLMALVLVFLAALSISSTFQQKVLFFWNRRYGDKGVSRKINDARFAQAMVIGISSGLPVEEAVDLASTLLTDTPAAVERCQKCSELLKQGTELSEAMKSTGVLPASKCRLLAIGMQSGVGDSMMEEISRRLFEEADMALESRVSQIEPALVLVTSLLVGIILLSVMLPLLNIMTAIG